MDGGSPQGRRNGRVRDWRFPRRTRARHRYRDERLRARHGRDEGPNPVFPYVLYGISGAMALAAVADLSVILRRGLIGAQRIARHLWRMCFGLFIAVGSFAAQGATVLPPGVRLPLLLASIAIVLIVMVYWLVRVLLTKWYSRAEQAS